MEDIQRKTFETEGHYTVHPITRPSRARYRGPEGVAGHSSDYSSTIHVTGTSRHVPEASQARVYTDLTMTGVHAPKFLDGNERLRAYRHQ